MPVSLESQEKTASIRWYKKRISQRILLGEYAVLNPRFDAVVTDANFLHMPASLAEHAPLDAMNSHNVDVAAVQSCPVGVPLPKMKRLDGVTRYVTNQYKHYFIRLEGAFEDYLAAFQSKTRSTVQRKVRKYEKHAPEGPTFRVYRRPEEMEEFVRLARTVAEKTFQEHLFGYGLPDTEEFRREIVERARVGAVEGYMLFFGDRPVSYIHGPITDGSIILYDHVGYDPEFRKYSPGTVLQYYVIEHLFRDGRLAVYDLCTGEGEHKRIFANDDLFCADLYYFRGLRHAAVFYTHTVFQKISRSITWTLEKLKVKSHLKRFLRNRA
jgi:hypothetical protein